MNAKLKIILVVAFWLLLLGVGVGVWRLVIAPHRTEQAATAQQQERQKVIAETTGQGMYDRQINFTIDGFGGFAVLRSDRFRDELAKRRIKVNLSDDGADYEKRIAAFRDNRAEMGVFTLDALLKSSVGQTPPATVVALVDETRGADAMVGYNGVFPNLDALRSGGVKFVLAPGPSETLASVLMSSFRIPKDPSRFTYVADAKQVYESYKRSKPEDPQVYVLWEPWVGKMLENPNVHVLVDSSRFRGYILDVIVANRDFLHKNPEVVQAVLECYFTALYGYRERMPDLLIEDCVKTDSPPISRKEAERLASGIWWKNTSDNWAQFGIAPMDGTQHLEDVIGNIGRVLGTPASSPSLFYYDGVLKKMKEGGFYPGAERTRDDRVVLEKLTDQQWASLLPVGELEVPPIVFARGSSILTEAGRQTLADLAGQLKTWQHYYVVVNGNASKQGDPEANRALALLRAQTALDTLVAQGVDPNRIRVVAGQPTGETTVTFILGQVAY